MADVTITPQNALHSGVSVSRNSSLNVVDTHIVRNNGRMMLLFEKTGAGACNVTIQTPAKSAGLDVAEQVVIVPATTGDVAIGPFPQNIYNDMNGDLRFTIDDNAGLSVAVIQL